MRSLPGHWWHCSSLTPPTASSASHTSPGAHAWAVTSCSVAASWPGARVLHWSAWCWHRCCPRCWAWTRAPRPAAHAGVAVAGVYRPPQRASLWRPWGRPAFRRLLAVFMLNGIASAIPATLVLFFIQDRLQAPPAQEPMFLAAYFVCAALSIPLWLRAVARWGLARTWLAGMLLAIAVFVWTAFLGAGDVVPFLVVCALSGVALGTDLALPSALLAGVIAAEGDSGQHEG